MSTSCLDRYGTLANGLQTVIGHCNTKPLPFNPSGSIFPSESPIIQGPMPYSLLALARNALNGHRSWPFAWRDAAPKPAYDAIIIGGGGHGLATA